MKQLIIRIMILVLGQLLHTHTACTMYHDAFPIAAAGQQVDRMTSITFTEEEIQFLKNFDWSLTQRNRLNCIQPNQPYEFIHTQCTTQPAVHAFFQYFHPDGRTPYEYFFTIILNCNSYPNIIHALLTVHPRLIQAENRNFRLNQGLSALMIAARWGKDIILELILAFPQDLDRQASTEEGTTALCEAAKNGHASCVEKLLRAGAHPTAPNKRGNIPLCFAAGWGHTNAVSTFINFYKNLYFTDNRGAVASSLFWLINFNDAFRKTPLMWAARMGHFTICELLLSNGANPEIFFEYSKKNKPCNALHWASVGQRVHSYHAKADCVDNGEDYKRVITLLQNYYR